MTGSVPYLAPEDCVLYCEDCAPEDAEACQFSETDSPSHCEDCGCLLDEALTATGLEYVEDALREYIRSVIFTRPDGGSLYGGTAHVLEDWREHWASSLDDRLVSAFDSVRDHERQRVTVLLVTAERGCSFGPRSGEDASGAYWTELVSAPEDGHEDTCSECGAAVYADGWHCLDGGEVCCSSHVLTPEDARRIAADWHGGQDCPLYGLASSGYAGSLVAYYARLQRQRLDVPAKVRAERPGIAYAGRLPQPDRQAARRDLDALAAWSDAVRSSGYAEAIGAVRALLVEQARHGTYHGQDGADHLSRKLAAILEPYGLRLP